MIVNFGLDVIEVLPDVDYRLIGQRIKAARLRKGLNQSELADMIECSNNHMSHIETGQTKLSLPMLLKIAFALDENLDFFLFDTPFVKKETLIDGENMKKLQKCEPSTLIAINKIIDTLLEHQASFLSNGNL